MRRVLVLLVALGLSGCWLQPGFGPSRQNSNPYETGLTAANVDTLTQTWSVPNVDGSNAPGRGQPLVSGSTVYTESSNNGAVIQARVRETGALRWQRDGMAGERILAVNDSEVLVYFLSQTANYTLAALDPATGTTLRSASLGAIGQGLVFPDKVVADDTVVAYAFDSDAGPETLVVRSRSTFDVLWSGNPEPAGDQPVLFGNGRLYMASGAVYATGGCGAAVCDPLFDVAVPPPTVAFDEWGATLLALTDDGHSLWHRGASYRTSPRENSIVSMNADGTPAWTYDTGASQVAALGDTVFTTAGPLGGTSATAVVALDGLTGEVKMTAPVSDTVSLSNPLIVAGGLIYIPRADPTGTKVDIFPTDCGQPTCSRLRSLDIGPGSAIAGMSEAAATLFVANGSLQAYNPTG